MDSKQNFLEKSKGSVSELAGNRFKVIMLSEGLGNLQDAYFYTKEALQSAVMAFEGAQCMADHPSISEDHDRPERSVKDVVGHYENVSVEDMEGRSHLTGELSLVEGASVNWVREQLKHAIKYSQKYPSEDFIGLSINASGDAEEKVIDEVMKVAPQACQEKLLMAKENGVNIVKVTSKIDSAVSCDLVTHAGAGGRVIKMLEQEKNKMSIKNKEADASHDDEDKDMVLIKSMLDKYMGDKQDKEDEKAIRQTAKAYKDAGSESTEAAYEAAAKHLKVAKAMKSEADEKSKKESAKKEDESKKEACKKEDEAKKEDESKKEAFPPKKDGDKKDAKKSDKKDADDQGGDTDANEESAKKEEESEEKKKEAKKKEEESEEDSEGKKREAALLGEIAGLKAKLVEKELEEYMEKKLKESGAPRSATKKFRECLEGVKSSKEFDSLYKVFSMRFESAGRGESFTESNPEKSVVVENTSSIISFNDCID